MPAGVVGASYVKTNAGVSVLAGTVSNSEGRQVRVLPAWLLHGTQPSYWTAAWAQKEKLADYDRVAGTVHELNDMDEVIRLLDEADDAP